MGNTISKEDIIKTVTTLETYVELRLDTAKSLPSSLIDTTLNLPPGSQEVYLDAHLGDVEISANLAEGAAPPISTYLGAGTTLPPVPVVAQPKPPSHPSPQVRKSSPSPRRRDPTKPRGRSAEKTPLGENTKRSCSYQA